MVVAGTRPEVIKLAPVLRAAEKHEDVETIFVGSGQHYDVEMFDNFVKELELPKPLRFLKTGSGTQAEQTSKILLEIEKVLDAFKPDIVLVEGDTNTVLAVGISAVKLHIPLGHVEAGLRSYDRSMPEEINRTLVANCAELQFAPTEKAALNLIYEGLTPWKIYVTGNTIVDACLQHVEIAGKKSKIMEEMGLKQGGFILITLHRVENVDIKEKFSQIIEAFIELKELPLIFPIHPRTKKMLEIFDLALKVDEADHIKLVKPLSYLDFLWLLNNCAVVLTDSGGVQEEALTLKVPCVTLRESTERPETVMVGGNVLVGAKKEKILETTRKILGDEEFKGRLKNIENPLGDGKAGERILEICKKEIEGKEKRERSEISLLETGLLSYMILHVKAFNKKMVKELERKMKVKITAIYNEDGEPEFFDKETIIKKGTFLRIKGEKQYLIKIKKMNQENQKNL